MARVSKLCKVTFFVGVLLDQATKTWANDALMSLPKIEIIPSILTFQLVHNYGAAYGILEHYRGLLIVISVLVIALTLTFKSKLVTSKYSAIGVSFLITGTMGNLIDRVLHGYVIDFINIHIIPVFNIADICINIAIFAFLAEMIFIKNENTRSNAS